MKLFTVDPKILQIRSLKGRIPTIPTVVHGEKRTCFNILLDSGFPAGIVHHSFLV